MNRDKPRQFLVLGALVALPLLMIGVAPALQVFLQRIDPLEDQVEILEGEPQAGAEQVEILEGEPQTEKEQVETLEAESLALDARAAMMEAELGADDLRFSDADGVEIGRLIDAPLQAEVSIYLEELAVIARRDATGNLGTQVANRHDRQLDCQGPPFLQPPSVAANAPPGRIDDLFLVIGRGGVVGIPNASVLQSSGCQNTAQSSNIEPVVTAELLFDSADSD
jgi:hypothetical protein